MTIPQIFFSCAAVAVIGIIVAVINMATAMTNRTLQSLFITHCIAGLMYVLGGLGALVSGIVWIVTYLKH
jgi:hypothetical protein